MSLFSALFDSKVYSFEQVFEAKDITSDAMQAAIRDWYALYYADRPNKGEDPSQRLPVAIVNKLTKAAFSEYKASANQEVGKGDFLESVLKGLDLCRKKAMQQALIGGECFLKPVFTPKGPCFSVIGRQNFLVLGRSERDEITDVGMAERTVAGRWYYTLLERRTVDGAGYLTIISRLYRSDSPGTLGNEVPLATLEKYARMQTVNRLPKPLLSTGLVHLKTPLENCVDGSPDGVAAYAPAAGLIHLININEAQISGEFERGESRIIISGDLLDEDVQGEKVLRGNVFEGVDDSPDQVGVTIFSPAFREQSFLARKAEYLRNVESLIGLKRGILSEVEAVERTATEITSSAGDYNLTIIDFQQMWEGAVREAVRVTDILGQMYQEAPDGPVDPYKDIMINWGNGVLYDRDKAWAEQLQMVQAGMLRPEIALAWYYSLPSDTPGDLAKIRERYLPELESLLRG